jgi:pimeloyl-ACP methyl ester carboxylesterase
VKVVFLHALPLNGAMWPEEFLALGRDSLAPDLYELGDSIESWASGVAALTGSEPMVLVGNSVGGSCAIEMARLAPERVRLLVLIGAKAGHNPDPEFRDAAVKLLREEGMAKAWATYWEPLFGPDANPMIVQRARDIASSLAVDDVIRGVRVFHGRPDRSAFLEDLHVPVLVVSGEHDRNPAQGAQLAATLRSGAFRVVPNAGHYVPIEQPALLMEILQHALVGLADAR